MNDLKDALAYADAVTKERFYCLRNTEELRQTVLEMFDGRSHKIIMEDIEGTYSEFETHLVSHSQSCDEVVNIIHAFEKWFWY